jgi:hypothetical protein
MRSHLCHLCHLWLLAVLAADCGGNPFSRKYEYEEDVFLNLDGSATMYVNASLPALVALRGADLPVDPRARLDRRAVRRLYDTPVSHVANVSASRRDNRRYVHLRIDVPDIRKLADAPAFAWSTYVMRPEDGTYEFAQTLRDSAGRSVGGVGWTGRELVAVRLHLPSRVTFHNSPSREVERGNIIVWEQPLAERVTGAPLEIVVRMDTESILARTLTLFGLMIVAVAFTFAVVVWWIKSRSRGQPV